MNYRTSTIFFTSSDIVGNACSYAVPQGAGLMFKFLDGTSSKMLEVMLYRITLHGNLGYRYIPPGRG